MTYGTTPPTITPSYSGFVNGDSAASLTSAPSCVTTATATSAVSGSPYPATCSGASDPNYTIGYTPGSVTVTAAATPFTITISAASVPYGSAATIGETGLASGASGTVAFTSGSTTLCTITLPAISCPTSTTLAAGSYRAITGAFADTDGNYADSTSTNTVSLNVTAPTISAPVAVADHYVTSVGTTLNVHAANGVLANDTLNGAAIASHTNPAHGTLDLGADGSFSYTPAQRFSGVDTFTYTLHDPSGSSTARVTIDVGARADLSVTFSAPTSANPGSTFTYRLTVTNTGPDPATGVTSILIVAPGATIVSISPHPTVHLGSLIIWSGATLAPSASVTYSIVVTVVTRPPSTLTAFAVTGASGAIDPNPTNNGAITTTKT